MVGEAIATVAFISGRAQARAHNGDLRTLRDGDTLVEDEIVITPDGGRLELTLSDGSALLVTDMPEMAITRDLIAETATCHVESAVQVETLQAIFSALQAGQDLGLHDTASGGGFEAVDGLQGESHFWMRAFKFFAGRVNNRFVAKRVG